MAIGDSPARQQSAHISDANLALKAAGLIAADTLGGTIIDIGDYPTRGDMVVRTTALEIATGDETYRIKLQGSSSATFASDVVELASVIIGDGSTIGQGQDVDDPAAGTYVVPFSTIRNGEHYRYLRYAIDVAGTIATGANFTVEVNRLVRAG